MLAHRCECGGHYRNFSALNRHKLNNCEVTLAQYEQGGAGQTTPTQHDTPEDSRSMSPAAFNDRTEKPVETEKPHRCVACGERFEDLNHLKYGHASSCESEIARRNIEGQRPYRCLLCGKRFYNDLATLKKHHRTHPTCVADLACPRREDAVQRSSARHDTPNESQPTSPIVPGDHAIIAMDEESYHCEACGRIFPTLRGLNLHRKVWCGRELASQPKNEFDPRMSDESEQERNNESNCQSILVQYRMITAEETWDKPSYFWNHGAYCNLEARLCAKRLGMPFPNPECLGQAGSEDRSFRGMI
ncbi:hypothetical protein E8E11_002888, partial [Didymella keratinophila]